MARRVCWLLQVLSSTLHKLWRRFDKIVMHRLFGGRDTRMPGYFHSVAELNQQIMQQSEHVAALPVSSMLPRSSGLPPHSAFPAMHMLNTTSASSTNSSIATADFHGTSSDTACLLQRDARSQLQTLLHNHLLIREYSLRFRNSFRQHRYFVRISLRSPCMSGTTSSNSSTHAESPDASAPGTQANGTFRDSPFMPPLERPSREDPFPHRYSSTRSSGQMSASPSHTSHYSCASGTGADADPPSSLSILAAMDSNILRVHSDTQLCGAAVAIAGSVATSTPTGTHVLRHSLSMGRQSGRAVTLRPPTPQLVSEPLTADSVAQLGVPDLENLADPDMARTLQPAVHPVGTGEGAALARVRVEGAGPREPPLLPPPGHGQTSMRHRRDAQWELPPAGPSAAGARLAAATHLELRSVVMAAAAAASEMGGAPPCGSARLSLDSCLSTNSARVVLSEYCSFEMFLILYVLNSAQPAQALGVAAVDNDMTYR
jgi:hypothetical protein